jgi:exodeoxyribonuclease-3
MKLISWNVNGIRAVERKGNLKWLFETGADILCVQETKANPEQLSEYARNPAGYQSYFAFPSEKKGYSGVAVYTKIKPVSIEYGLKKGEKDREGRIIIVEYKDFTLLNVYFPNGGGGPERLAYKLKFYKEFLGFVENLRKKGKSVIFCGDINTAHNEIDLARPKENEKNTGFLPVERKWIDLVIKSGFIDTFRYQFPKEKEAYTYWDMKTFARERNVGWRIDYFFVSSNLISKIKKTKIYSEVFGSDHCPISLEI